MRPSICGRLARMREKIAEYAAEGAEWPLAANILDPVRSVSASPFEFSCSVQVTFSALHPIPLSYE
jgi:hypothetical protein